MKTLKLETDAMARLAASDCYAAGAKFENRHSGRIATVKRVEKTGCVLAHPNGTFFYDFDNIERNWKPHNAEVSDRAGDGARS